MFFTTFQNEKTPFQVIKRRRSKSRKINIFPIGLTHGFGPKMAIFLTSFFQAMQARKMSFRTFQHEKTAFQALKTRSFKRRKIPIFLKGFTHGFGPKMAIFLTFLFRQNWPGKCVLRYFRTKKKAFLGYKKKTLKKSKNCYFSKGVNPLFLDKNGLYGKFFLLGKIGQENVFYYNLERKNTLLGSKKRSSKSRKIAIFPKELTLGFGPKMATFSTSFFQVKEIRKKGLRYSTTKKRHSRL